MLKIETREENGWIVVALDGQIDLYTSPDIRKELAAKAKVKKARVAADLTKVTYIDSSGLATFIEALQKLKKVGGEIVLVGLGETVKHVFEIARLDGVFKILKTREELS